ncbi:hypothetical protein GOP47_0028645, partial [Adiantum capillus-veneris]
RAVSCHTGGKRRCSDIHNNYTGVYREVLERLFAISINIPTKSAPPGYEAMPSWNDISDDHVLHSLGIAAACMDDGGWTLVMCSTSSLPIVGCMFSKVRMEVHLRWLTETTEPYAYTGKSDFVVKENAFHVLLLKRPGCTPLLHFEGGRWCLGMENDHSIIENHLRPLIASYFVDCPQIDMARFMCQRDDHFDRPLVEKQRTRSIYVDDLALHSDDTTSSEALQSSIFCIARILVLDIMV